MEFMLAMIMLLVSIIAILVHLQVGVHMVTITAILVVMQVIITMVITIAFLDTTPVISSNLENTTVISALGLPDTTQREILTVILVLEQADIQKEVTTPDVLSNQEYSSR